MASKVQITHTPPTFVIITAPSMAKARFSWLNFRSIRFFNKKAGKPNYCTIYPDIPILQCYRHAGSKHPCPFGSARRNVTQRSLKCGRRAVGRRDRGTLCTAPLEGGVTSVPTTGSTCLYPQLVRVCRKEKWSPVLRTNAVAARTNPK